LKQKHNLKEGILDINYEKRERMAYQEYQIFLENIKVLDPACGSGAFLVKVFDYLLKENKRVGQILGGGLFADEQFYKIILTNNIFGVDLSKESVEITKLSLWLKTALKNKKLTSLDNNIKCGNSLISDPDIAGNKAFDWKNEFKSIFALGGFDVIVGNPPYFNVETLGASSVEVNSIQKEFPEIWQDKSDILFYFFGRAIGIAKGKVGFIVSNAFLFSKKAQKLRNYLLDNTHIQEIINFEQQRIFADASVTTAIVILDIENRKQKHEQTMTQSIKGKRITEDELIQMINNRELFYRVNLKNDSVFALVDSNIDLLNMKIDRNHKHLNQLFDVGSGMQTAANDVFIFDEYPSEFISKYIKKRVSGEIIHKYVLDKEKQYLLYIEDAENFEDLPINIQSYLLEHQEILKNRADKKRRKTSKWWNYSFPMHKELYNQDKIWCSYRAKENIFAYDNDHDYIGLTNTTVIFNSNKKIDLKYILALLNSKVLNFRYKSIGKQTGDGIYEYFENGVGKLPIPEISPENQQLIVEMIDKLVILQKNILLINDHIETSVVRNNYSYEKELRGSLIKEEIKVSDLQSKLDDMVFDLYQLNNEERLLLLEK
jgi:hypothetical protein